MSDVPVLSAVLTHNIHTRTHTYTAFIWVIQCGRINADTQSEDCSPGVLGPHVKHNATHSHYSPPTMKYSCCINISYIVIFC